MLSSHMDERFVLHRQTRCRRGSLPIKKRKFLLLQQPGWDDLQVKPLVKDSLPVTTSSVTTATAASQEEQVDSRTEIRGEDKEDHHKIMALVNAASFSYSKPESPTPTLITVKETVSSDESDLEMPALQDLSHTTTKSTKFSPTTTTSPQRMHSPLPGHCQGRTSRTQSFCRRPCYKNSRYCKLHSQQLQHAVSAEDSAPNTPTPCRMISVDPSTYTAVTPSSDHRTTTTLCHPSSSSSSFMMGSQDKATTSLACLSSGSSVGSSSSSTNQQLQLSQDKRYMGSPHECRCKATTTRGRACAYVAAAGTNYCFLHADYETNPPPRRKAAASGETALSSSSSTEEAHDCDPQEASLQESSAPSSGRVTSPLTFQPSNDGTTEASSSNKESKTKAASSSSNAKTSAAEKQQSLSSSSTTGGQRTPKRPTSRKESAAKLAEKHAVSPWPLLSMISTDQWFHKRVRIAVGPMKDQMGQVEKWGNGWVSVAVPGVGLHNRRSFELYLLTDEQTEQDIKSSSQGKKQHKKEGKQQQYKDPQEGSGASPSRTNGSSIRNSSNKRRSSLSSGTTTGRSHVVVKRCEDSSFVKATGEMAEKWGSATVAASAMEETDASSQAMNLEMILGTDALERGRRSVQKPSRFKDTAGVLPMKRGRKVAREGHDDALGGESGNHHHGLLKKRKVEESRLPAHATANAVKDGKGD